MWWKSYTCHVALLHGNFVLFNNLNSRLRGIFDSDLGLHYNEPSDCNNDANDPFESTDAEDEEEVFDVNNCFFVQAFKERKCVNIPLLRSAGSGFIVTL